MSRDEWERIYRDAWTTYYTDEHMKTILRRIVATRGRPSNAVLLLTWFKGSIGIEGVHPLEGGALRLKFRRDRRPGFAIEPRWKFYPKYFAETISKVARWIALGAKLHFTYRAVKRDVDYTDIAITAVAAEELELLEAV
jgi:hypothetical protein